MTITVTMRREELFEAETALNALSNREADLELCLVVAKNKRLVGQQISDIKEALKPRYETEEEETRQKEYDEAQFRLSRQHQGDSKELEHQLSALQLKYADELFRRRATKEANEKFLQEEMSVEMYEVPKSLLPTTLRANELGPMVLAIVVDKSPAPIKKKKKK
jgi:hypothetical protein